MSELLQEKKTLTFEEICPKWTQRLINMTQQEREEYGLKLIGCSVCFVGEAHGGNQYGGCEECLNFCGFQAGGLCYQFSANNWYKPMDWEEFEQTKQAFVKHFNEVHVK